MSNRNFKFIAYDIISCAGALLISFLLRFDFEIPASYLKILIIWVPLFCGIQIITFYLSDLYDRLPKFTSLFDIYAIFKLVSISSMISFMSVLFITGFEGYPRSTLILFFVFNLIFTSLIRVSIRVYFTHFHKNSVIKTNTVRKRIILLGAGKTGDKICRELMTSFSKTHQVIGFIDDDIKKIGGMLHGKKILTKVSELPNLKIPFDEIIITAPLASGQQMRKIVRSCKETGKRYRTVPGLHELMDQKVTVSSIRDVSYADLLGREEVKLDMNSIDKMISGKRVLITGAGGSIGSELVRQTLKYQPSELICLDHSEEKIFNLSQELDKVDSLITIKIVLASINNIKEIEKVFLDNRPEIVFHAAAYKHVPIQEIHPWTAVRTNVGGTLNLVNCANKHKSTKFILVSTDKAVNPVNVMGATKRVAERIIQSINQQSKTSFMAVRFGNVLGSSGSAIPIFQKQINKGGPITITHPEMTRYFMSIQEASQLILQCGSIGKEGEIFLLEMGKPIKILQMAKDLIRLSGFEPDIDIPIVFTGLRPGEKLYEELQLLNEKKIVTSHKKIMVLKSSVSLMKWILLSSEIKKLIQKSEELDAESIQRMLKKLSPDYQPNLIRETKKRNIATDFKSFKAEA